MAQFANAAAAIRADAPSAPWMAPRGLYMVPSRSMSTAETRSSTQGCAASSSAQGRPRAACVGDKVGKSRPIGDITWCPSKDEPLCRRLKDCELPLPLKRGSTPAPELRRLGSSPPLASRMPRSISASRTANSSRSSNARSDSAVASPESGICVCWRSSNCNSAARSMAAQSDMALRAASSCSSNGEVERGRDSSRPAPVGKAMTCPNGNARAVARRLLLADRRVWVHP